MVPTRKDIWRIAYIPHTAPGGRGYVRAYGWGYLAWPGILAVVVGAAGLAFGSTTTWKLALVYGGFALVFAGVALNGLSERRTMTWVMARCMDVEVQFLGGIHMQRSAGHAVRARMRYRLGEQEYEATPGQLGYDVIGSKERAEAFAAWLRTAPTVPLYVDPEHPTRALFVSLQVPQAEQQAS